MLNAVQFISLVQIR